MLKQLYTQGGAAYVSVRNLVKATNLPVWKVRQIFYSKPSYTKCINPSRKFRRFKAFVVFKSEILGLNLAYFHQLAKDQNGVKYLVVPQDLFDRTVDAKRKATKDSKETVRLFLTLTTKKLTHRSFDWQGNIFTGEFKKSCKAEKSQF